MARNDVNQLMMSEYLKIIMKFCHGVNKEALTTSKGVYHVLILDTDW